MRFHWFRFSLLNSPRRGGWRSSLATGTRVSSRGCTRGVISMRGRFGPAGYPFLVSDTPSSGLPATFSPQAGRRRLAAPVQVPFPRLRGEG
ncbi:hypothetical protein SAMCCGM7_pC2123 (plasmid) [Sinorhizobium americanum CCGM7]|nr:hypothetical protein SAMCCGM7_pC2123 [Sinorhizobium americanum CCGM7]